jgi:hypothetical protein
MVQDLQILLREYTSNKLARSQLLDYQQLGELRSLSTISFIKLSACKRSGSCIQHQSGTFTRTPEKEYPNALPIPLLVLTIALLRSVFVTDTINMLIQYSSNRAIEQARVKR